MLSSARAPMRLVMTAHSLTATPGVRISRGSRKAKSEGLSSVEITLLARRSSCRLKGSSTRVVQTLKIVWQNAMPTAPMGSVRKGRFRNISPPNRASRPRAVPMRLKEMWMTDTRLALRLTPMEEIRAVTQVPMFWPMKMGMAMP